MSEELKPIRMDGKYQTRDGRAVRVLCVDRECEDYPVIALISNQKIEKYTKTGLFIKNSEFQYDQDLIEVDEQVRYVNVYGTSGVGMVRDSIADVEGIYATNRTGTLKITHINGKLTSVEIVEDAALAKARGEA